MSDVSPSLEQISELRNQAFNEVERVSGLAASYARSTGEAAFRGDETTMLIHMKQLRLCCVSMIQTYKDYLQGTGDDQGIPEGRGGSSHADRAHQRPGDGAP